MYRLLKLRRAHSPSLFNVSFDISSGVIDSMPSGSCSLCKILNNYNAVPIRNRSTVLNPVVTQKKYRTRKKKMRNYAELLVVTDKATTEQKASIHKLNSNDFKLLVDGNLNFPEFYKLGNPSTDKFHVEEHTYNNLTVISHILEGNDSISNLPVSDRRLIAKINTPTIPLSEDLGNLLQQEKQDFLVNNNFIPDIATIIERENDFLPSISTNAFQPETVEEDTETVEDHIELPEQASAEGAAEASKVIKQMNKIIDQKARQEMIHKSLASYVEVCAFLKMPHRGTNALNFHRSNFRKNCKLLPIKDINVYNGILKGYAEKGNFTKISEMISIIEQENVEMNIQSYIAIFECLGRINVENSYLKFIRIYAKKAFHQKLTFNDILNKGAFLSDQREKVLLAMKSYDPQFEPKNEIPHIQYDNRLVDLLNHRKQLEPLQTVNSGNRGIFTPTFMKSQLGKQIKLETTNYTRVNSIELKEEPTEEILKYRQSLSALYQNWENCATEAFNRDLTALRAKKSSANADIYMKCIPIKDFVAIIVDEATKLAEGSETYSPTVNMLYKDLGSKVYGKYKVLRKQKTGVLEKISNIHKDYCIDFAHSHAKLDVLPTEQNFLNPRQRWQWIEHKYKLEGATLAMDHQEWVPTALQFIGKFLYHIIMHDLKIDVNSMKSNAKKPNFLPAFYTIFRTQGRLIKEEVKPHPILSKLYRASSPAHLTFPSYELPMLCPPIPWTSMENGGYLISACDLVRLPIQAISQKQRIRQTKPEHLYPSLDSLNQLGAIPWKVNTRILDTILKVFNSGGSSKLTVPEPPSSVPPPTPPSNDADKTEKYAYFRQKMQNRRKKAEMYSLWCDCLYRLSLANHFRDEIFWLPHNMDFRGRVYPIPPHLNHLGSDLARSMLMFAEPRPLGPDGLNWLKIHLINLTGLKKRDCIDDRLQYAEESIDLILDSADNPLNGSMWWASSEEPWQTLACCIDIAAAVRSPDHTKYLSHFPIHQDGSCNGLQHYAALGRDCVGAHSVNLCPSATPQDVYSAVVALVEEKRKKDAEHGLEVAKLLDGFVKRKVIKQTVMTTVYGVTRFGARLQILRQLKDIDNFPKDQVWAASHYLTAKTFESLRSMFTSTREIQDWFTECARLISAIGGQHVEWVTPLGFPIVQPYFRYKKIVSKDLFDCFHMDKYGKPNVMKQKNAFPPNFIHSLDSSHMMLTSLNCERDGITFVSVHDCYWTHPSTVQLMNKICREQFVALHSQPILEDLSIYLSEKFSYDDSELTNDGSITDLTRKKLNRVLVRLPSTGDLDINQVLDSVYFFS